MAKKARTAKAGKPARTATKTVETLKHDEAKRRNIPTAEYQSVLQKEEQNPVRIAYPRKPKSGRIAVKVINHLGDEVMKVFRTT